MKIMNPLFHLLINVRRVHQVALSQARSFKNPLSKHKKRRDINFNYELCPLRIASAFIKHCINRKYWICRLCRA
jgi:hypothetical protein